MQGIVNAATISVNNQDRHLVAKQEELGNKWL
jgi:hypothetical protein